MIHLLDPISIVQALGLAGVIGAIFAESGLFFGFFLPGDSLLFTAGFFASQGHLNLWLLLIGTFIAAVLGDSTGYWFGRRVGPRIFTKEESFFFRKSHVRKTEEFYNHHGRGAVVLARFIPIVRTFAPILAGVGRMDYSRFIASNIAGGFLWSFGLTLGGYFLGSVIPNADRYLLPIVILIIVISVIPPLRQIVSSRRDGSRSTPPPAPPAL